MGILDIFRKQNNDNSPNTAEQRKKESEKLLRSLNIPYIDHLPLIEEGSEVKIRTAQEITERILILVYLAYVTEVPDERENVIDFLKDNLLWTINKVDKLELPTKQVEITEIVSRHPKLLTDPTEFIETANNRPTTEILDILDLTYRLHWATRNADLNKQTISANLSSSVLVERHYAINWVTYYADE